MINHENSYPSEIYKVLIKDRQVLHFMPFTNILYMESHGHLVSTRVKTGEIYIRTDSLKFRTRELSPFGFFEIKKGLLVNMAHVSEPMSRDDKYFVRVGEHLLPVSNYKMTSFLRAFTRGQIFPKSRELSNTRGEQNIPPYWQWLHRIVNGSSQAGKVVEIYSSNIKWKVDMRTVTHLQKLESTTRVFFSNQTFIDSNHEFAYYEKCLADHVFRKISEDILINVKHVCRVHFGGNVWHIYLTGFDIEVQRAKISILEKPEFRVVFFYYFRA